MSNQCPVCYNDVTINNVMNLKCNHQMCTTCYYNWTDNHGQNSCPCCRDKIYTKEIANRIDELYDLNEEKEELQDAIYSLNKNKEEIQDDRDNLIYESVKYERRLRDQRFTLRQQEWELQEVEEKFKNLKRYSSEIKAIIPDSLTEDHRKLAIHFRGIAKFHDDEYNDVIKIQKFRVVKSLEHIIKKKNNTHDILKLSVETNSKSKKRYREFSEYYEEEVISIGNSILFENEEEEISIGNSILFENEEEDSYEETDSDYSEMPELEEGEILEEEVIDAEGRVYTYYSSGDYIVHLPNLGTNV